MPSTICLENHFDIETTITELNVKQQKRVNTQHAVQHTLHTSNLESNCISPILLNIFM